jgi:CubicO group peptidase (beta-lactamase class C family)
MRTRLARCTPEAQGIASGDVSRFVRAIADSGLGAHSLMLLRHGHVVAEGWWAPYSADLKHQMYSLSKSFTSTAIGMAVAEGLLSPEDRVLSFFPEDAPEKPSAHLEAMRVRHLLTMTTGHMEDTIGRIQQAPDGNWARAFLRLPVEQEPGTQFVYNTGATYMLSGILRKAAGQDLLDYLQPRLFAPLGIEGATWERCPRGLSVGGYGLNIVTEDMAKFGLLYLNRGVWEGRRILQENWVAEATSKQVPNDDGWADDWRQGYGYQFWRCRHGAYRGDGAFGQFCVVMPEQDAVLAMTGGTNDLQGVLNLVWEHLLPAMKPGPLAEDRQAASSLKAQLESLRLDPPAKMPSSPREQALSATAYRLEKNERDWESVSIRFADKEAVVSIRGGGEAHELHCGRETWLEGTSKLLERQEFRVVAAFTWETPDRLLLTARFVETPYCLTVSVDFGGSDLELSWRMNVGFDPAAAPPLKGRIA